MTPKRKRIRFGLVLLALVLAGGVLGTAAAFADPVGGVDLNHLAVGSSLVATGFSRPTAISNAGDGSNRLFVVQQQGTVSVLRGGIVQPGNYLDMRSMVTTGGERGLLNLVFAPSFKTTGRMYVYFTDRKGTVVIQRLTVSDPTTDTPTVIKRKTILSLKKSYAMHNGGGMAFGPDGYLYIGIGDGGPFYDAKNHAQNHALLFGKLLRIDPGDRPGAAIFDGTYKIPRSNPFYRSKGYRKEIWALGLRNPWRISFDAVTGDLWIGDVGQDKYEEVDFQKAGRGGQNYGWRFWEGFHRLDKKPKRISKKGFTFPIFEYKHPYGEAVQGGYVYRGSAYPALYGTYLCGDWVAGFIAGIRRTSPGGAVLATPQHDKVLQTNAWITTFGVDEQREMYFSDWKLGAIYRITATTR